MAGQKPGRVALPTTPTFLPAITRFACRRQTMTECGTRKAHRLRFYCVRISIRRCGFTHCSFFCWLALSCWSSGCGSIVQSASSTPCWVQRRRCIGEGRELTAVLVERNRIAREFHDTLAQG